MKKLIILLALLLYNLHGSVYTMQMQDDDGDQFSLLPLPAIQEQEYTPEEQAAQAIDAQEVPEEQAAQATDTQEIALSPEEQAAQAEGAQEIPEEQSAHRDRRDQFTARFHTGQAADRERRKARPTAAGRYRKNVKGFGLTRH